MPVLFDLDVADLPEVRRRIVDPVLRAMFRPSELSAVELAIGVPELLWWEFPRFEEDPRVWLRLRVGDETFEHRLAKPGFWLDDATWLAHNLAGEVQDWIAESGFGWGRLRTGPDDDALPGPPPSPPGVRTISVHFNDPGYLPLWENGGPADPATLPLSQDLISRLHAWHEHGHALADAAEAACPPPPITESGVWVTYVSAMSAPTRKAAADVRRDRALDNWRTWINELQPGRDALVEGLRDTLGNAYLIPTPPRLPTLS
jgi:hypothetical protein